MSNSLTLSLNIGAESIDPDSGLIKGVSLITEGEVIGHSCFADNKTNQTVLAACDKVEKVKVKINHSSDAATVVGVLKNFRIEGSQVKADLQLLKNSNYYSYILEMAKELAGHFGLSIAFKPTFEELNKKKFVRCTEIYSADIVDSPAANPNGLFAQMKKDIDTTEHKPADKEQLDANVMPSSDAATTDAPVDANANQFDDDKSPVCPTCKKTSSLLDRLQDMHDAASATIASHKKKIEDQSVAMAAMQQEIATLTASAAMIATLSETAEASNKQIDLMVNVLDALNNKLDTYKEEFDTTKATFEATATANLEEFETKLTAQKAEFDTKLADTDVIACRKLAKTGVALNVIPSADVALSVVSIVEQLDAIKNPMEKAAFYTEHKAEIYKAYQANINKRLISNTAN